MTVATFLTVNDGINPFTAEGPAVAGSGVIVPQFRLGHVAYGDAESEFVYCKYTSVSNQVLSPGLLFTVDDDYTATLLTTSNSPRGSKVMACCVGMGYGGQSVTTVTGSVYYLWLARSGQVPVAYTTMATVGNLAETTATGGAANFPNSATVSSKLIVGLYITKAVGGTFTANTTNGSPVLTNVSGLTIDSGPSWIGSTVSGTGIPGSTTISSIQWNGTKVASVTLSANATATGSAITITNSLVAQARLMWPYVDKTN
jgi:hypothetical protein